MRREWRAKRAWRAFKSSKLKLGSHIMKRTAPSLVRRRRIQPSAAKALAVISSTLPVPLMRA